MDLIILYRKAVSHKVHSVEIFSPRSLLDIFGVCYGQSVERILSAFVKTWCTIFTAHPNRIRTDHQSIFTSKHKKKPAGVCKVELRVSVVKENSLFRITERLHDLF